MIPIQLAPEPSDFDARVRQPGVRALHERIGRPPPIPRPEGQKACARARTRDGAPIERFEDLEPQHFPDYWRHALDDLYEAYGRVCAYCCFHIHPITGAGSVDHFDPKSVPGEGSAADDDPNMIPMATHREAVYEWSNYRLASGRLNARKSDYQDVVDPFEVGDDWFEMEFVAFQLEPGSDLPDETRARVAATIIRLGLNDKGMREARESDFLDYTRNDISFTKLERESPLVAREVIRAGKLRPEDRHRAPDAP